MVRKKISVKEVLMKNEGPPVVWTHPECLLKAVAFGQAEQGRPEGRLLRVQPDSVAR